MELMTRRAKEKGPICSLTRYFGRILIIKRIGHFFVTLQKIYASFCFLSSLFSLIKCRTFLEANSLTFCFSIVHPKHNTELLLAIILLIAYF